MAGGGVNMRPYWPAHLLRAQVDRAPERPAVIWRDEVWSYATLYDQVNALAHLLAAQGVGPGDRVCLLLDKSNWAIAAIYGILQRGAAYVPLDPKAPPSRLAEIIRRCEPAALIAGAAHLPALRSHLPSLPRCVIAREPAGDDGAVTTWLPATSPVPEPPPVAITEQDLAYILFTSGSTGTPKGVMISGRAALAFVEWAVDFCGLRAEDRLGNHAPLHFDLSVFDLFGAAAVGAAVVPVPAEVALFAWSLAGWIDAQALSVWYSVPSVLTQWVVRGGPERFAYASLRCVLFAGEVFPVKHLRSLQAALPHVTLANLYGPTETNVCTAYRVPRPLPAETTALPIGRACANCEVFALDDAGEVVQPGGEGELYVRGPTLMQGYWRDEAQSRHVLLPDPRPGREPRGTVYRTGDWVRLDAQGDYAFVGRRDGQIKSRGYRIELGEIEAVLLDHPAVLEVIAVALPDEEFGARLAALLVMAPGASLHDAGLRAHCATRLPAYMIPVEFRLVAELPKTATGKLDRRAAAAMLYPPALDAAE